MPRPCTVRPVPDWVIFPVAFRITSPKSSSLLNAEVPSWLFNATISTLPGRDRFSNMPPTAVMLISPLPVETALSLMLSVTEVTLPVASFVAVPTEARWIFLISSFAVRFTISLFRVVLSNCVMPPAAELMFSVAWLWELATLPLRLMLPPLALVLAMLILPSLAPIIPIVMGWEAFMEKLYVMAVVVLSVQRV